MINTNDIVSRKTGIVASEMDGDTVMMDIDSGNYYNLGSTGGIIWSLCNEKIRVSKLIEKLEERYNVEHSVCEKETIAFLGKMVENGLILVETE